MKKTDVIIIGSGIAALQLATQLRSDLNVIIFTKSSFTDSNSYKAQGGIACALGKTDNVEKHFTDTLEAGRYLQDQEAVRILTKEAPNILQTFIQNQCPFDKDWEGNLLLGKEGAHSENRIIHGGGDQTGRVVTDFLKDQLGQNITVIEHFLVYQLLIDKATNTCFGLKGKNADNAVESYYAEHVVLAAGGAGQVYACTSNAKIATGDGIALAYQVGAELVDMEFVQFHPTLLYVCGEGKGLISEAVRGEGAVLSLEDGTHIMDGVHPMGDLAPRHVVSQTIYRYITNGQAVYLDISMIKNFEAKFPSITKLCHQHQTPIKDGKIPVAPGSHFLMGGVKVNLQGQTNINRLYAIGEVAASGVHGANRLASNSLLEGLVFGNKLATFLNNDDSKALHFRERPNVSRLHSAQSPMLPDRREIQKSMMELTGIVRSKEMLEKQLTWLESFQIESLLSFDLSSLTKDTITTIFMLTTAKLITASALIRKESRGAHFRTDYPIEIESWKNKRIVQRWKAKARKEDQHEQIKAYTTT
ncbi:L-aspartate oxidase [Terrihalobacillus insolitus]|uniref:L-aspartate oxidase n=1 Tax=Terrihalobacillus insolitus TaxID=2950438 RepID=UPI002341E220|nr:L-aspartate oxidase [Terrihalobacillus insolitus]MDC3411891.1 L-aspartate oxidase [Terrihalobacillus insolitus]